ncbi:conserved hypothetical protein [Vibrio phage 501E54-1]|nr:conserved hypothetical protein [Vibrio phage 501E54-1]
MRIVTVDIRMLSEETRKLLDSVPHFGNEKIEGTNTYKSTAYNQLHGICLIEELCYTRSRSYRSEVILTMKLKQLSSIIAVYDQINERYWMVKDRYINRGGWFTKKEFQVLVLKEAGL